MVGGVKRGGRTSEVTASACRARASKRSERALAATVHERADCGATIVIGIFPLPLPYQPRIAGMNVKLEIEIGETAAKLRSEL